MKFSTFERQGNLVFNRLVKLKEHVSKYVAKSLEELSEPEIEELFQFYEESGSKYKDFQNSLNKLMAQESIPDFDESKLLEIEDRVATLYFSLKSLAKPFLVHKIGIDHSFSQDTSLPATASSTLKLPPLTLKTFSGTPEQWLSFCSLYVTSVHNNTNLTDIEKFQYLLSSLQGEPFNLIKNLPISSANYTIAWDSLYQRYQNNRKIVMHHVNNLIDLPNIVNSSAKNLRTLVSVFQENIQALLALKHDVQTNNVILSTLLLRKLNGETRKKFEDSRTDSQKIPDVQEIIKFLESECCHMEAANLSQDFSAQKYSSSSFSPIQGKPTQNSKMQYKPSKTVLLSSTQTRPSSNCSFCGKSEHVIYHCIDFQKLTSQEKFDFIKTHQFCFNCLGSGHTLKGCKSKNVCYKCNKKHHTWLHLSKGSSSISSPTKKKEFSEQRSSTPEVSNNALVAFSKDENRTDSHSTVLLGTTLVQVTSSTGNSLVVRAVVDSASMVSVISENIARHLSLERNHDQFGKIDGVSSCQIKTKGCSRVNMFALNGTSVAKNHPVIIVDKITSHLPHSPVTSAVKEKFKNLVLADPTFYLPSAVDLLIGADLFMKIVSGDHVTFGEGLPVAMNTVFGYVLIGSAPSTASSSEISYSGLTTLLTTTDVDLHRSLQQFWTIEEPPLNTSSLTPEEEYCEKHFEENVSRETDGRYIVRLPFKEPHAPLGNSFDCAKRRFLSLEKRLNSDETLKQSYVECMNDYLQLGHMEMVTSPIESNSPHCYLPHHAVIKEESSSTKTRVVFDASARTSTGVSLNDTLHPGPKLQNEIVEILINFRCFLFIMSADVQKMFRQIKVHPEDRSYQLLLWRKNTQEPLQTFQLTTVVFGISCSPYLAIRTLKQLIKDEGYAYPRATKALENQIYVDDLFIGANSIEDASKLQQETVELLSKGGFNLRKWKTNCPELAKSLPEEHKEKPIYFQDLDNSLYSLLGIKWTSSNDSFTFHFAIPKREATKRNILSTVAKIFDPCGWLAPVTFWTKSLLQLLWSQGHKWDEPISPSLTEKWARFLSQLPQLSSINISRCLQLHAATDVQLHGFSDGSEAGYSAAVYVRITFPNGHVESKLLLAKSKVAPLKKLSIPRLELCGAYLLAKLLNYSQVLLAKHCTLSSTTAWCDSTVVLSWIKTPTYRLKIFVANRVAQIQDWLPPHSWSHVSTHMNPADCASRGLLPSSLIDHQLWWQGPPWLQAPETAWPTPRFAPIKEENLPEVKQEPLRVLITAQEPEFLSRFSSWTSLLRIIAYVLRFLNNSRKKSKLVGSLKLTELNQAQTEICKIVQYDQFSDEIEKLKSNKLCSARLLSLSPFLDKEGVLRVGGRIKNSVLPYAAKHPIVLPKNHHITNMIIDYYHLKYLHAGPSLLQATISQTFWILSARGAIRNRVFKCTRCFRCRPKLASQKMGDLPSQRVTPSRVFNSCGTDYMGPFMVKPHTLRKVTPIKVYICVFVCFAVKAVHLEVVTSLTSEAYIAALYRFVSRRGLCSDIYSDCGTNFVGAASEIQKIIKTFFKEPETKKAIEKFTMDNQINFHFLPPAAPHQGGLWERAVRSIKHHLRRTVGDQLLTLEEFMTLSTRVEAILNSRPLTRLSSDPAELNCLTPGHFLVGGPLLSLPEPDWTSTPSNRLSRWQQVQAMTRSFWRRWSQEYLHTLQQRGKWRNPQVNIKIGDLAVIHEPNSPPLSWRLGRVTGVSPGSDGLVRVVHLQSSKGPLSRPITKVSPLPLED